MNRVTKNIISKYCADNYKWILGCLAILLIVTMASLGLLYSESQQHLPKTAARLISVKTKYVASKFSVFLQPAVKDLEVLASYLSSEILTIDDSKAARLIVDPILAKYTDVVSGLIIADSNGREFKLIEIDDEFKLVKSDYDPRTRPWFGGALSAGDRRIFWSQTYRFYTSGKYGMTVSIAVSGKSNVKIVAAFDISLENFGKLITRMSLPKNSYLFIQDDRQIVDMSFLMGGKDQLDSTEAIPRVEPIVRQAASTHSNIIEAHEPFSFKSGGKIWWSQAMPLAINHGNSNISLVISQQALVQTSSHSFLTIFIIIFLVIVILAIFLLLLLKHQNETLQEAVTHRGCLDFEEPELLEFIRQGEGDSIEFKSTMRVNLHTGKTDKTIEIACLKTVAAFLNSYGGTLIVGVKDNGEIIGLANDRFDNFDKFMLHFNNLVTQHLGMDCIKYFAFDIKTVNSKDIFVVNCQRSTSPVFLAKENSEDFYVRVGPGTRMFKTSEAFEYIKHHF